MSEDMKEESNPTPPEVKEDDSSKVEGKAAQESPKDSDKNDAEKDVKEDVDSGKEESGKESEEEDEDDEETMGLLDRPVEVTGCRARKKVERLEVSFHTPKDKEMEIPEGKGQKLGQCPRIEFQIQKYKAVDLRPLHRILFNKLGAEKSVKRNIRKFSGFPFDKDSDEYKKKLLMLNKYSTTVLKRMCLILDVDRGGQKDSLTERILEFLLTPQDSGKNVPQKKSARGSSGKKKQKKVKSKKSDDEGESANDVDDEKIDGSNESVNESNSEEEKSDDEPKKKSKPAAKSTTSKDKTKKSAVKSKKVEKKTPAKTAKRKRDVEEDDESSDDDDKPLAKKSKMPSDDEIKKMIKGILDSADLQEITMKKVINQVSDAYPDFDLTDKKAFIKSTVKTAIS
ncbi:protein DEK-like isoform X3 [Uloborus diversus]|uniref:protein DEK-like isoform X3 n=1 Tax=Uloborus diversus TaxID=327109 RepID=UPI00240A085C|nr:protein DEK-like isoform X3 [Uloborus diversus]